MNQTLKIVLSFIAAAAVLGGAVFGLLLYKIDYAKTEIVTAVSDDGGHQLVIHEIGEPGFPFSSAHCRFTLRDEGKKISRLDCEVCNDGGWAQPENFSVHWQDDRVIITVSGEEQSDAVYTMGFDGSIAPAPTA